jgi:threonine dehydrogenase-like Zn-dependent dehydrogenase
MSHGKLDVKPLITHTLPLERVEEGIRMLHEHAPGVWKIAIVNE